MKTARIAIIPFAAIVGLLTLTAVLTRPASAGAPRAATLFAVTDGSGTACSQSEPCALQTALAQAVDGDTIYVGAGIYRGTGDAVLMLDKSITLLGGWNGGPMNPGIVRWPETMWTVIDGESQRRGIYADGPYSITVDGFVVMACQTPAVPHDGGAGVSIYDGANMTLRRVVIRDNTNTTAGWGGGVYVESASVRIEHSAIISNTAQVSGGGLAVRLGGAQATVVDTFIAWNSAGVSGHGVRLSDAAGTFVNTTIVSETGLLPDGLYATNSPITLTNNVVVSNTTGIRLDGTFTAQIYNNDAWGNGGSNWSGVTDPTGTNGNLSANPLFVARHLRHFGPGDRDWDGYFLAQVAAGQPLNSPAWDAGDRTAALLFGADTAYYTTRTDGNLDEGVVDLGYHYRRVYVQLLPVVSNGR